MVFGNKGVAYKTRPVSLFGYALNIHMAECVHGGGGRVNLVEYLVVESKVREG